MRTDMFIKSYRADAAVAKHRLVKAGAADGSAAQAAAATDAIMGVADSIGGATGEIFDVIAGGYASVTYGGVVTRGAPLTSDADGKAIVATVAGSRLIGYAVLAGALNDVGTVHVQLGTLATA
jgi:hypothetical protein